MRKYPTNDLFWEDIKTEPQSYWLGFCVADGYAWRSMTSSGVELKLSRTDDTHARAFRDALSPLRPVHHKTIRDQYKASVVKLTSKPLYDVLSVAKRSLGLPPIADDLIRHWLRGYWDGDGYVGVRALNQPPRIGLCGPEERLLKIDDYLLGALCVGHGSIDRPTNSQAVVNLTYNRRSDVLAVACYLYANATVCLLRKLGRIRLLGDPGMAASRKLPDDAVVLSRYNAGGVTQRQLAIEYGVTVRAVSLALQRQRATL